MSKECLFCQTERLSIVMDHGSVYTIEDKFPVTRGHMLIIPFAHKENFFDLSPEEKRHSLELLDLLKDKLCSEDTSIDGFNIGMNCGESAGQTIFHCHIHLIPRRSGDTLSPKGGVRGVIPEKQAY